ncbi:DnaJ domain-containing protein, partial [Ochromonadaceae sp. CCMP2298]
MNHYQILDINSSCSQSEIKKAYRSQVKKYHPDINPDPTSTDRIIKINEAYEILSE